MTVIRLVYKGGTGSGNFGHAGRPGKVGGSAGGGVELDFGAALEASRYELDNKQWLEEHFDMNYPLDAWGQISGENAKELQRIRDMYVVKDDKTVANNGMLRGGGNVGKWARDVDYYVSQSRLKQDSLLYRGAVLPKSMVEDLRNHMTFTDKGFMSTSSQRTATNYMDIRNRQFPGNEQVIFRISATKGQTIGIMDVGEFVMPRNTTINLTSYNLVDGVHVFDGEVS